MIRAAVLALLLTGCGEREPTQNDAIAAGGASVRGEGAPVGAEGNGMHGGMDTPIAASELPALMRRARAGDNQAAESLGYHFGLLGQRVEERRWYSLAASRGHCGSMAALGWIAYQDRDRATYDRWNGSMREHQCTLGRMLPEAAREMNGSIPLWDDQPEVLWNGL